MAANCGEVTLDEILAAVRIVSVTNGFLIEIWDAS